MITMIEKNVTARISEGQCIFSHDVAPQIFCILMYKEYSKKYECIQELVVKEEFIFDTVCKLHDAGIIVNFEID